MASKPRAPVSLGATIVIGVISFWTAAVGMLATAAVQSGAPFA